MGAQPSQSLQAGEAPVNSSHPQIPENLVEVGNTYVYRHPKLRYVAMIRTALGLLLVVVVVLAAINSLISLTNAPVGIYLVVIAVPIFLLEVGFVIRILCGTGGICCRVFSLVLDFDRWKRGLLYIVMCIPCFIKGFANNFSIVTGVLLIVTGLFYIAKGYELKQVKTYSTDSSVIQARPNLQSTP